MTTGYLGYITAFDAATLHNGTTRKALTTIGTANVSQEKMFVLPNGTKINYDGTTDTNKTPGQIKLDYWWTDNGENLYDAVQAKIGNRGTVTKTKFSTVSPGTETCNGVLLNISINDEKSRPQKGHLYVTLIIELEDDWS